MRRFAWASYGMYILSGVTAVLLGAIMPEWLRHYHASYGVGGRVVFIQAIGFLLGVPLAARAARRLRLEAVLSAAAIMVTIAQLILFTFPPFWLASLVVVLNGVGAGALESLVAAVVLDRFVTQRAIYMSRLEVSFGLGALLLPALTGGLIVIGHWRSIFLIVAAMGLILAAGWQVIRVPSPEAVTASGHHDAPMAPPPPFPHRTAKVLVLGMFLMMTIVYVGLEGSINSFMPSLFVSGLHARAAVAELSDTIFWIGMVFGRMAIHWVARHLRYDYYLGVSISLVLLLLLTLTRIHAVPPSLVVMFVLGLAMAAIYSLVMVYANHTFPGKTATITSLVTAMAGFGAAVFPAMLGYAMDRLTMGGVLWILFGMAAFLLIELMAIALSFQHLVRRTPKAELPG